MRLQSTYKTTVTAFTHRSVGQHEKKIKTINYVRINAFIHVTWCLTPSQPVRLYQVDSSRNDLAKLKQTPGFSEYWSKTRFKRIRSLLIQSHMRQERSDLLENQSAAAASNRRQKYFQSSINQSINILFYACSYPGDIRPIQKNYYTNLPTGLWAINLTIIMIDNISIIQNISYVVASI